MGDLVGIPEQARSLQISRPGSVLFMCNMNQIRSPMAASLARSFYGRRMYVRSAGVQRGSEDGFMIGAMREVGIDVSGHQAKHFSELGDTSFDLVIALSDKAHSYAEAISATFAMEIEHWEIEDPSLARGTREQIMMVYRAVRDDLALRILDRFGPKDPSAAGDATDDPSASVVI